VGRSRHPIVADHVDVGARADVNADGTLRSGATFVEVAAVLADVVAAAAEYLDGSVGGALLIAVGDAVAGKADGGRAGRGGEGREPSPGDDVAVELEVVANGVAARIADELFQELDAPVRRVAAKDTFVAYQPILENAILPQPEDLLKAIKEITHF